MLKHLIVFLILSALLILGLSYVHMALKYLWDFYEIVLGWFGRIFTGGDTGYFLKHYFTIMLVPLILGGVIALIHFSIRRGQSPYVAHIVWVFWLILATLLVIHS
jgi:hypothetical protein